MKKVIFFLLWITSINLSFCQETNDTLYEPLFPLYSEIICEQPQIAANNFIMYSNTGIEYIRFHEDTKFIGYEVYLAMDGNIIDMETINSSYELVFSELDTQHAYQLLIQNTCNEIVTSIDIDNVLADNEKIEVSQEMMDLINLFTKQSEMNLIDFFRNDSSVNYYEKFSFLQKYGFGNGQSEIPWETPTEGNPPKYPPISPPNPPKPPTTECNCKIVILTNTFSPGSKSNGNIISFANTSSGEWKKNHKGWNANMYSRGPAKHMDLWARGKRIHGQSKTFGFVDGGMSPNKAQLDLTWLCTINFALADCGCTKSVDYTAQYDTRLRTGMQLPTCTLCGSKGGRSHAEDWAVLSLMDVTGDIQILGAGRASTQSQCNKTWNKKFFTNILDAASPIALDLIKLAFDSTAVLDTANALSSVVNLLKTIIETPITFSTQCNNTDISATLLDPIGQFQIVPNRLYSLRMYSFGSLKVDGFTSWDGQARIASDFNMAIANIGGIEAGQEIHCCTPGFGQWLLSSFSAAPVQLNNLKDEIDGFMQQHLLPYNYSEYGNSFRQVCRGSGSDDGYQSNFTNQKNKTNSEIFKFLDDSPSSYSIWSVDGKLIEDGQTNRQIKIHDLQLKNFQNGIYFIRYQNSMGAKTDKVLIQNSN